MNITNFNEKYNKLDGNIYTVEEIVNPVNGIYEALLIHDNVTKSTVNVYTGSRLTGDKINTFVLSTPSLTPWKYSIRILSNISPLYISYETTGDEIEAEDINNLQDAVNNTQNALNTEISRAETAENTLTTNLNLEISRAKSAENVLTTNLNSEVTRATSVENTITNTININKPIWDDKYTKNEIDNKFSAYTTNLDWKESVATYSAIATTYPTPDDGWTVNVKDTDITYRYSGSAWIAISANAIPLATSSLDGKMSSSDKTKLDGITPLATKTASSATNGNIKINDIETVVYTHPATHSPSIIVQDSNNRFVTDSEITNWNNKLDSTANAVSASKWATARNISLSGDATGSVSINGSADANITVTVVDDSHNHTSSTITDFLNAVRTTVLTGLSTATNSVISATDTILSALGKLQAQLSNHTSNMNNPHSTTASQVGLGNVTNDLQVKRSEMGVANGVATLDSSGINNQAPKAHTHDDRYYTETESDAKYATKDQISNAGYGDMLKSVYDTNNDGIVDNADKLDGKHATEFAYSGIGSADLNTITQSGMYRINSGNSNAPSGVDYGQLLVVHGSADTITQIVTDYSSGSIYWRSGNPPSLGGGGTWGTWRKIWHDGNLNPNSYVKKGCTWNDLKGV